MKKLVMTVVLVIGMVTATFALGKETHLTLEDNKLHYNYYSPFSYKGIVVDRLSKLVLVTEEGDTLILSTDDYVVSQKGHTSESITVSYDLTEQEVELLSDKKVVEVQLLHANGRLYHSLQE